MKILITNLLLLSFVIPLVNFSFYCFGLEKLDFLIYQTLHQLVTLFLVYLYCKHDYQEIEKVEKVEK